SLLQVVAGAAQVEPQFLNDRERFQWSHRKGDSGRHGLDRQRGVEVVYVQSRSSRDCFAVMLCSKHRIDLRHLSKCSQARRFFKSNRNLSNVQLKRDLLCSGIPTQRKCRPQCGMTSKWQFFLHRENSDSHPALALCFRVARKNKRSLREIHLFGDQLHLRIADPTSVKKYSQ